MNHNPHGHSHMLGSHGHTHGHSHAHGGLGLGMRGLATPVDVGMAGGLPPGNTDYAFEVSRQLRPIVPLVEARIYTAVLSRREHDLTG